MMKRTIEDIKKTVAAVSENNPVERVYLFGSYARGTATEGSDIDLRIDLTEPMGLFRFCGLLNSYQDALDSKVDLLITRSIEQPFLQKIQKEEMLLYERK